MPRGIYCIIEHRGSALMAVTDREGRSPNEQSGIANHIKFRNQLPSPNKTRSLPPYGPANEICFH